MPGMSVAGRPRARDRAGGSADVCQPGSAGRIQAAGIGAAGRRPVAVPGGIGFGGGTGCGVEGRWRCSATWQPRVFLARKQVINGFASGFQSSPSVGRSACATRTFPRWLQVLEQRHGLCHRAHPLLNAGVRGNTRGAADLLDVEGSGGVGKPAGLGKIRAFKMGGQESGNKGVAGAGGVLTSTGKAGQRNSRSPVKMASREVPA